MRGYKPDLLNPDKCKVERGKVGIMFTHQTEIRLADATFHETIAVVENIRSAGVMVSKLRIIVFSVLMSFPPFLL